MQRNEIEQLILKLQTFNQNNSKKILGEIRELLKKVNPFALYDVTRGNLKLENQRPFDYVIQLKLFNLFDQCLADFEANSWAYSISRNIMIMLVTDKYFIENIVKYPSFCQAILQKEFVTEDHLKAGRGEIISQDYMYLEDKAGFVPYDYLLLFNEVSDETLINILNDGFDINRENKSGTTAYKLIESEKINLLKRIVKLHPQSMEKFDLNYRPCAESPTIGAMLVEAGEYEFLTECVTRFNKAFNMAMPSVGQTKLPELITANIFGTIIGKLMRLKISEVSKEVEQIRALLTVAIKEAEWFTPSFLNIIDKSALFENGIQRTITTPLSYPLVNYLEDLFFFLANEKPLIFDLTAKVNDNTSIPLVEDMIKKSQFKSLKQIIANNQKYNAPDNFWIFDLSKRLQSVVSVSYAYILAHDEQFEILQAIWEKNGKPYLNLDENNRKFGQLLEKSPELYNAIIKSNKEKAPIHHALQLRELINATPLSANEGRYRQIATLLEIGANPFHKEGTEENAFEIALRKKDFLSLYFCMAKVAHWPETLPPSFWYSLLINQTIEISEWVSAAPDKNVQSRMAIVMGQMEVSPSHLAAIINEYKNADILQTDINDLNYIDYAVISSGANFEEKPIPHVENYDFNRVLTKGEFKGYPVIYAYSKIEGSRHLTYFQNNPKLLANIKVNEVYNGVILARLMLHNNQLELLLACIQQGNQIDLSKVRDNVSGVQNNFLALVLVKLMDAVSTNKAQKVKCLKNIVDGLCKTHQAQVSQFDLLSDMIFVGEVSPVITLLAKHELFSVIEAICAQSQITIDKSKINFEQLGANKNKLLDIVNIHNQRLERKKNIKVPKIKKDEPAKAPEKKLTNAEKAELFFKEIKVELKEVKEGTFTYFGTKKEVAAAMSLLKSKGFAPQLVKNKTGYFTVKDFKDKWHLGSPAEINTDTSSTQATQCVIDVPACRDQLARILKLSTQEAVSVDSDNKILTVLADDFKKYCTEKVNHITDEEIEAQIFKRVRRAFKSEDGSKLASATILKNPLQLQLKLKDGCVIPTGTLRASMDKAFKHIESLRNNDNNNHQGPADKPKDNSQPIKVTPNQSLQVESEDPITWQSLKDLFVKITEVIDAPEQNFYFIKSRTTKSRLVYWYDPAATIVMDF